MHKVGLNYKPRAGRGGGTYAEGEVPLPVHTTMRGNVIQIGDGWGSSFKKDVQVIDMPGRC